MPMTDSDFRLLLREIAYEQAKLSTSAFFFRGDERLRLRLRGSLAGVRVAIETRVLNERGDLVIGADELAASSDRTETSGLFSVGTGFLLSASLRASSGAPRRGEVFAVLEVVRGLQGPVTPIACVLADYVTDTQRLAWPGSALRHSAEGPGVLRSITGTDPAAGVEISETVPTDARWMLRAISFELVTAAVAATRRVTLVLDDGATIFFRAEALDAQITTLTRRYSAPVHASYAVAQVAAIGIPTPLVPTLQGGHRIRTLTVNLQAGDDFGAPQLLVEEWLED